MCMCSLNFDIAPEDFKYSTDETYQQLFQRFFQFTDMGGDIYDEAQVKKGMKYIMQKTLQESNEAEWWRKIFTKAAAMFLSEDLELGLCVCLNFSFFDAFYKVFYALEKGTIDEKEKESWKQDLEKRFE